MNITTKKSLLATMVGLFAATGAVQQAYGQDGEAATAQGRIDEIIVTATKRETSLQDTAMSISVLTGDALEKAGVVSIAGFLETVPGVTFQEFGPGNRGVSFRGTSVSNYAFSNTTSTASYFDEVPFGGGATLGLTDLRLVDIERTEVIKGPQGTLYGKSAMGGILRYITNKPDTEAVSGGVQFNQSQLADSDDSNWGGQGYVNIPVTDTLAVRAVGYKYDNAGFIDNLGTGTKDADTEDTWGGRLALRWNPTDNTTLDATYLKQKISAGGGMNAGSQVITSSHTPTPFDNAAPFATPDNFTPPDLSNPSYVSNVDATTDSESEVLSLKLQVDFEGFDLNIIGSTQNRTFFSERDSAPYVFVYDGSTQAYATSLQDFDTDTFEIRLISNSDGMVDWIAGLWYSNEEGVLTNFGDVRNSLNPVVFGCCLLANGDVHTDNLQIDDEKELAGYAEVGFRLSEKLRVSLGYRHSRLELDQGIIKADGTFDGSRRARIGVDEGSEENIDTYKINVEYTVSNDFFVYALASSGYRPGGFNGGTGLLGIPPSTFESDTVWNYETGARAIWFDGRLKTNATLFRIDWSDIQLSGFDRGIFVGVVNAGEARVNGLEAEFTYLATDSLNLSLNYAYVDAEFAEDNFVNPADPSTLRASKGDRLPGSAEQNVSVHADWLYPMRSDMDLTVGVSYRYVGDRLNDLGSTFEPSPSYGIANARVGIVNKNGINATLFADNLSDKRTNISAAQFAGHLQNVIVNRPRTIGIRVGYDF